MVTKKTLAKLGKMIGHKEGMMEKESKKEDMMPGDKAADMKYRVKKARQMKLAMVK